MAKITQNVDADTVYVDGEKTRLLGVNTAESTAVNEERNTEEGEQASQYVKDIVPEGTQVETSPQGKGAFGRRLADVKVLADGRKVDMGLLLLDGDMSQYNIDYGKHPDPEQHDIYKEYYSENSPYQYGDKRPTLSQEDMTSIGNNIAKYKEVETAYRDGSASRTELENAMANAYSDGNKVAQYRWQLRDWDRAFNISQADSSDRMAFDWAMQSDENRAKYDSAIRQSHTGTRINPEKSQGFWQSFMTSAAITFKDMNDFAVLKRHSELENTRRFGSDERSVEDAELIEGISDPAHQAMIIQEAADYGDEAALLRKDQLLDGLERKEAMSDMPLAVQIATAVPALIASPMTLIPGAKIAQTGVKAGKTIDGIMKVGKLKNVRIPTKVAMYGTLGATEAGIAAIPRITMDDSYTAEDMKNEIIFGAAFGVALPVAFTGAKRLVGHTKEMLAVQKKVQAETEARVRPPIVPVKQVDVEHLPKKQLTEEGEHYLDKDTISDPIEQEKVDAFKEAQRMDRAALTERAIKKTTSALESHVRVEVPKSISDSVTSLGGLTKSLTQSAMESPSQVLNYVGDKILELPQGYGGAKVRAPSATLIQSSKRVEYQSMTQPSYHKLVKEYAAEGGSGKMKQFIAQHMDDSNDIVNKFSRDIMDVIESRRQGRASNIQSPSVLKMADDIENSMIRMFDDLVEAGVDGFRKDRRIKNYYPQLWNSGKMLGAITRHGRDRVEAVLAKGYMQSAHNSINTMSEALHVAKQFIEKVGNDVDTVDYAVPETMSSRARTRLDIDSTASDGELSVMDLMDTDTSSIMAKYANRAAGSVATSKATGGAITGDLDWDALRTHMKSGKASKNELDMLKDAQDIVMGRPTRGGLETGLREIKDAVAQSKMGGLGMAQLAEAGAVISKSMRYLFSDPKVFAKIWKMAGESTDNVELMRETQALSGISNEVHLLDRQAVHLDQKKLGDIQGVKKAWTQIASKMSFGGVKAPAGYVLAQTSGFNAIRRFERRLTNASFLMDTAKHFKDGTGKMSADRLRDIGLDPESVAMKKIFKDIVEYDEFGIVSKLNIDQWDKKTREAYHYAMYRDDATMVQQTIGGELPAWANTSTMSILTQFKTMAMVASKKSTQRNVQFADTEAVMAVMMNMAMASFTRTAKFATLGGAAYLATGDESHLIKDTDDYLRPENYVTQFGIFPDIAHSVDKISEMYDEGSTLFDYGKQVAGEVPMLDWAKDYYNMGAADTFKEKADAAKGVMILGNLQVSDTLYKALEEQLD